MAFKGQFTYGIPVTAINIVDALPDNAVIPASVVGSRKGDVLGISVANFLALSPGLPSFIEYNESNKTVWNNGNEGIFTSTSFGEDALALSSANSNTAFGYKALGEGSAGFNNVAVGAWALRNTGGSGIQNVAVGATALENNTSGANNIVVGTAATSNTSGSNNVAIGHGALTSNTIGTHNIAIGRNSSTGTTSGEYNVSIGAYTNTVNFSKTILLGSYSVATSDNQLSIGSSDPNHRIGNIATEPLTPTKSWTVRINGVNYKIALQIA